MAPAPGNKENKKDKTSPASPAGRTRRLVRGSAAAAMVTLSSFSLYKAVAATATLPIVAKIVRAIEITINTSLNFGTIALTENMAALATLDPNSNAIRIDTEGGVSLASGLPTAGRFKISGAPIPVQVSLETNNLVLSNGTTALTVNNFNFQTARGGAQVTVTPSGPENSAVLSVGATLKARPQQVTGTYVGSNTISANYQ